jgi:mannose-6-phosphate isomerase-like protein (cupin superfamily)
MSIINTKNSDHYKWGDNSDGWHLLKTEELSVIEELVPPGGQEERHFHVRSQQFFYILSGVAHLEISGKTHELNPGSGIHVPAGEPHQLINKCSENLRFLVISQPKSHGDRVGT